MLWKHSHCVTSQPLCLTSHPLYLCHHTQSINFIKPSVCMISQPLCLWYMYNMWHHVQNLGHHTTLCMVSVPLYLTWLPLYLSHHTHPIDDITATICMTSHPVYLCHHIHYMYDIISTKYDITTFCVDDATVGMYMTSFALQMITNPLYHTKPHYLWCPIHFRLTTQALCQTSRPLYLCHHTVSTDISPTFVWHHTHLLCDIIWTIYNITPNPHVISLVYLWHHSLYIWNHIQYEGNIYT